MRSKKRSLGNMPSSDSLLDTIEPCLAVDFGPELSLRKEIGIVLKIDESGGFVCGELDDLWRMGDQWH